MNMNMLAILEMISVVRFFNQTKKKWNWRKTACKSMYLKDMQKFSYSTYPWKKIFSVTLFQQLNHHFNFRSVRVTEIILQKRVNVCSVVFFSCHSLVKNSISFFCNFSTIIKWDSETKSNGTWWFGIKNSTAESYSSRCLFRR